jgi:hypothetical protein
MKRAQKLLCIALLIPACSLLLPACMSAYKKSVGGDADRLYSRVFIAEYTTAWESAVEAMKASSMDIVNRENGTLQTKWIDNTSERNLIDSNGSVSPYIKAQYRFRVSLAKSFFQGNPSVRVNIQKEQQIQRDVLEGWVNQETDGIQENSLLYRIGKVIEYKKKLQDIENLRLKKQLERANDEVNPTN